MSLEEILQMLEETCQENGYEYTLPLAALYDMGYKNLAEAIDRGRYYDGPGASMPELVGKWKSPGFQKWWQGDE